jgi:hypothetical protein
MVGYKIYLTRSHEVALLLSDANRARAKMDRENLYSTSSGMVCQDCRVPSLYHDKGYFYCILEYRDLETPKYELVFA